MAEDFSRAQNVRTPPGQMLVVVSLELFYHWGGLSIRSQRENSLRRCIYGAFTEGDESPQNDEAACSGTVWVLARGYSCHTTTWRNKLNKKVKDKWPRINRGSKAAGV